MHVHLQVIVRLNKGLGISLVDRTPEELVYIMLSDVAIEYVQENDEQSLRADVHSLQVICTLHVITLYYVNLALYGCKLY